VAFALQLRKKHGKTSVRVGLMSLTVLIMHADKLLAVMNIGVNNADC